VQAPGRNCEAAAGVVGNILTTPSAPFSERAFCLLVAATPPLEEGNATFCWNGSDILNMILTIEERPGCEMGWSFHFVCS
jgi:hypothetical protein